jgi:hypothetical protein
MFNVEVFGVSLSLCFKIFDRSSNSTKYVKWKRKITPVFNLSRHFVSCGDVRVMIFAGGLVGLQLPVQEMRSRLLALRLAVSAGIS